jgi:hypothetical protein
VKQATTIGLDIAKRVFQVHGAGGAGHVLFRKRITRVKPLGFLAPQTRCVIAMEACAGCAVLLPCPLHVLLPRYPRFLGARLHISHVSHFRGPSSKVDEVDGI